MKTWPRGDEVGGETVDKVAVSVVLQFCEKATINYQRFIRFENNSLTYVWREGKDFRICVSQSNSRKFM